MTPALLETGDVLALNKSTLLFVPLSPNLVCINAPKLLLGTGGEGGGAVKVLKGDIMSQCHGLNEEEEVLALEEQVPHGLRGWRCLSMFNI